MEMATAQLQLQKGGTEMRGIRSRVSEVMGRKRMQIADVAKAAGLRHYTVKMLFLDEAQAIYFDTLEKLCRVLDCQPGDLFEYIDDCDPEPDNGDA